MLVEKVYSTGPCSDGRGNGSIYFVVDESLSTLMDFRYKRRFVRRMANMVKARTCTGRTPRPVLSHLVLDQGWERGAVDRHGLPYSVSFSYRAGYTGACPLCHRAKPWLCRRGAGENVGGLRA